ncbi:MAG: dTDP-4-dehydrorhamnose reductase [Bacteroidetes bacterium MedPE-SWsnd-G2]|nr:MAG: dTDP-4-dehydrorhamnose reductase [Bacteroidetes bacterium MedPE-SWsnd-G2]
MDKIWVTGGSGQLGRSIKDAVGENADFVFTDSKTVNLTDHAAVRAFVCQHNIKSIINCAAYTAVDDAEDVPESAFAVNHLAVKNLAELSKEFGLKLIHMSTDYVFDGEGNVPYKSSDRTNPINVYGNSKREGEKAIVEIAPPNTIIIRTAWVYSKYGKNFVNTMLRLAENNTQLKVVNDQFGAPTSARSIAKVVLEILPQLHNSKPEIFHYTNAGICTWFDFSKEIFKIKGLDIAVIPVSSEQFVTKAKRPKYSVLCNSKISNAFGVVSPEWQQELKDYLS